MHFFTWLYVQCLKNDTFQQVAVNQTDWCFDHLCVLNEVANVYLCRQTSSSIKSSDYNCAVPVLLYKVKTQYVQISNILDTSIKHTISYQSTSMAKGCINIMYGMVDTTFSYWGALIICQFFQESSKVKESSLYVIWNAHALFLLCRAELESVRYRTDICDIMLPGTGIQTQ